MSSRGLSNRIKLSSYEDMFSAENEGNAAAEAKTVEGQVVEIPLSELHPFEDHPFRVVDDENMEEMVESVKEYGVLVPAIARPRAEGGYELISGHRRKHASELAGKATMPVIVRDCDHDEAVVIMVDANLQREDILVSERARAWIFLLFRWNSREWCTKLFQRWECPLARSRVQGSRNHPVMVI